jgi:hypothetical protein
MNIGPGLFKKYGDVVRVGKDKSNRPYQIDTC